MPREELRSRTFVFTQHPEEKMFSADMAAFQSLSFLGRIPENAFALIRKRQVHGGSLDRHTAGLADFVASEEDHAPCCFCVSFKHIGAHPRAFLSIPAENSP